MPSWLASVSGGGNPSQPRTDFWTIENIGGLEHKNSSGFGAANRSNHESAKVRNDESIGAFIACAPARSFSANRENYRINKLTGEHRLVLICLLVRYGNGFSAHGTGGCLKSFNSEIPPFPTLAWPSGRGPGAWSARRVLVTSTDSRSFN